MHKNHIFNLTYYIEMASQASTFRKRPPPPRSANVTRKAPPQASSLDEIPTPNGSISLDGEDEARISTSTSETASVGSTSLDSVNESPVGSTDLAKSTQSEWTSYEKNGRDDFPRLKQSETTETQNDKAEIVAKARETRLNYIKQFYSTVKPTEDDMLRCFNLDPMMAITVPVIKTKFENKDFVLKAMAAASQSNYFGVFFKMVGLKDILLQHHSNDSEVMMKACFYDTDFVAFVPDKIRTKEFLSQLLKTKPTEAKNILKNMPAEMKTDEDFLANFIEKDPTSISVVPNNFREVSKILLRALQKDPAKIVPFVLPKQGLTSIGGKKTRQKRKRTRRRRTTKYYY